MVRRRNSNWMDRCQAWWSRVVGCSRDIWVRHVQARHDLAFEPFHFLGLCVVLMIEAVEVEKTVHREMCKVMKEGSAFIPGFPFEGLVSNDNVAEQRLALTNPVTGGR